MFLNQFCGIFAILTYAVTIFQESGSDLSPGASAIIIAAIQILGTVASFVFVDLAGRKVLLLVSTFGTGVGLSCLGTFSWLKEHQFDLTGFGWIPVVILSITMFIFCVGLCSIPFFVLPEILPAKVSLIQATVELSWLFYRPSDLQRWEYHKHDFNYDIFIRCAQGNSLPFLYA